MGAGSDLTVIWGGESGIYVVAMMGPHAPSLIRCEHTVKSQEARWDGRESEQLLLTHMREIERDDLVAIRPDIREVIAGLHRAGCDVAT